MSESAASQYVLPSALITRADLARLVRELEAIDNELEAQKARNRTTGQTGYHLPSFSQMLADFLEQNKVDATNDQARMLLREQLKVFKNKAPIMHMTFASEADPVFLQQLVTWLRTNIHPHALVSVGLQPGLVGGVYLRTPNHVHDFSLRSRLEASRGVIMQDVESLNSIIKVVEAPGSNGTR